MSKLFLGNSKRARLLVLIALQAGISLPSIPGRFGIFEYICVLALGSFGVAQPLALSYGLLLHFVVLVPTTVLGGVFFIGLGRERRRWLKRSVPSRSIRSPSMPRS